MESMGIDEQSFREELSSVCLLAANTYLQKVYPLSRVGSEPDYFLSRDSSTRYAWRRLNIMMSGFQGRNRVNHSSNGDILTNLASGTDNSWHLSLERNFHFVVPGGESNSVSNPQNRLREIFDTISVCTNEWPENSRQMNISEGGVDIVLSIAVLNNKWCVSYQQSDRSQRWPKRMFMILDETGVYVFSKTKIMSQRVVAFVSYGSDRELPNIFFSTDGQNIEQRELSLPGSDIEENLLTNVPHQKMRILSIAYRIFQEMQEIY